MQYIKVKWLHNLSDEPIILYSEIDTFFWEIRKIEVFPNGDLGYASKSLCSSKKTRLGIEPLPPLDEIASDPVFELEHISKQEFEDLWTKALSNG